MYDTFRRTAAATLAALALVTSTSPALAADDLEGGLSLGGTSASLTATTAVTRSVAIRSYGQVVDTFNGVPAKYIPGTGNSNTGAYSCAGYVKSYYQTVYGVEVHNLLTSRTPQSSTSGASFRRVTSGFQPGDIVYHTNSSGSGHWAIAKAVDGSQITLIEQNWKWRSGGVTYASVDRAVTYGSTANMKVFRLVKSGGSATPSAPSGDSSYSADMTALLFNAHYYAMVYPDLRQAYGFDEAALRAHWENYGRREGRTASPIFDPKWYLMANSDVAQAYGADNYEMAYNHYAAFGCREGRQSSPIFDPKVYLGLYPDLKGAFGENYQGAAQHFLTCGIKEGRQASAKFSVEVYSAANPDVAQAFPDPLDRIAHYVANVQYGDERRTCI